jgi:uncharacterized protein
MITRAITPAVDAALARQAAVAILGPRQVGKTTLALEIGAQRQAIYLDLEDPDDRARLASPALFLEAHQDQLVILDEIHRMPELFDTLRGIIDRGRRSDRGRGRFLILGSASLDLLRQSETLAGRIAYIEMGPLVAPEVGPTRADRERLWLRGGYPDPFLAATDREGLLLRRDFIRTYLERDVPLFGPRIPATTLGRFWSILAHHHGTLLNASELARALEISAPTVTRYIDLLSDLFLVRRLPAFHGNFGKRLTKSPRVYIRDSGLLHALLGIETLHQLSGHPVVGRSWEGFVIETLLSAAPWRSEATFYRTAAGAEMDLVLGFQDATRWVVEIKRSLGPRLGRGFHHAREDLRPDRVFVVHAGEDRYPMATGVEAIGILEMAAELGEMA